MESLERIELIRWINDLEDLDWKEKLSIEYSNEISTYWEVYRSWRFREIMEFIKDTLPIIALAGIGSTIIELIKDVKE